MDQKTKFKLDNRTVTVAAWVCIDGTRCVGVIPTSHTKAEVMYPDSEYEQGSLYHRMCAVVECLGGERDA